MADMLKFRKGTYAQINAAPKAAGTIYIAKDEKAMYVDVDASTRIRIGDFIRVESISDIPQPYSETAVYYVERANALLGYKDGEWKQINGTEELVTRLEAVEGDVATNKSDIGTLKTDVGTLKTDVSGLKTTIGTHGTDIEALKAAVGMDDEGNVEGLAGSVAQLRTDLTELETEVHGTTGTGGMVATLADHTSRIATLEGKDVALKSDVSAAKTAVLGQADGGADFNGTVKGAYEAAAAAQTQANKGVADAAAAQTKADTNENAISALDGRLTALDQGGTGKVAVLESKVSALEKKDVALKSDVTAAKNAVLGSEADAAGATTVHGALKAAAAADAKAVAADGKAATAQSTIDNYKTDHANDYTNSQIDTAIAAAKKAGDDAQADIDAWAEAHNNDYTNTQIDNKVQTVQNKVDEHSGYFTTLNGADSVNGSVANAKKAGTDALALIGDANSGLTKTVNEHTAALEILNGADSVNGSVANAKKVGTDAANQAETNRQNIASLTATVDKLDGTVETEGSVKKQIKDAVDDAKAELSAEIDADINAANAMTYKGTIGSESEFNTIKASGTVSIGDTYVVSSKFGAYQAGDFLIAKSKTNTEIGGFISTDDLDWNHVKSGYDASLDQKLTGADNKIKLSTSVGGAGTEVAFAGAGSIEISTVAATENKPDTITISMVWEDF